LKRPPEKLLPPANVLREALLYEPNTGKLYWRKRPDDHFPTRAAAKKWNGKFAGKEAFTCLDFGYRVGSVFNTRYKAHRIIWKIVTGNEPPPILDHRDKKRYNNRWGNIRAATAVQNLINKSVTNNKSGHIGIRESACGNWEARITKDGRLIHLGTHYSKEEAIEARRKAASEMYGEFAP
jgi:hypothetical protein